MRLNEELFKELHDVNKVKRTIKVKEDKSAKLKNLIKDTKDRMVQQKIREKERIEMI